MRFGPLILSILILVTLRPATAKGQEATPARLDLTEVLDLIKSQLPNLSETNLSTAAARGLIEQLHPKVQLIESPSNTNAPAVPAIAQASLIEETLAYIRLGPVSSQSPGAFLEAWRGLSSTNKIKGLILDLRFATGEDFEAAAQLLDPFFNDEVPILDWGKGIQSSAPKNNAIEIPLAVLINHQTTGAAEAIAGCLKHVGSALLIGTNTAGQASIYREFRLTTGQRLKIATQSVQVGQGIPISGTGLEPDLLASAAPDQERIWFQDPYRLPPTAASAQESSPSPNTLAHITSNGRRRINEADLVRMLREGTTPGSDLTQDFSPTEPPPKVIQDPALARAVDFLKAWALVRPAPSKRPTRD